MNFDPLFLFIVFACFAVVVVLVTGLGGFAKGSGWARRNANMLMRARIAAQFIAVVLIVVYILLGRQAG